MQRCGATNAARDLRGLTRRELVVSRTHKLYFTRGSLFSRDRAPKIESIPSSRERVVDSRYRRNRVTGSSLAGGWIPPVTRRCLPRNGCQNIMLTDLFLFR